MSYQVQKFKFQEQKELLFSMWKKHLMNTNKQRLQELYTGFGSPEVITLLINYREDASVGAVSLMERILSLNDKKVKIGVNFDMMIDKKHRTLGPALKLLKSLIQEAEDRNYQALLAMPNKMSEPIFARAGYELIGRVYRWSRVINFNAKLKKIIKFEFARKIAGLFLKIYWFFRYDLLNSLSCVFAKTKIVLKEYNLEDNDNLDRISRLDKKGLEYPRNYLEWRFGKVSPFKNKFLYVSRKGKAEENVGFIIYRIDKGDNTAYLESFSIQGDSKTVKMAVCEFIKIMKEERVGSISVTFYGNNCMEKILRKTGFVKRESRPVYVYSKNKDLKKYLKENKILLFFESDLDL